MADKMVKGTIFSEYIRMIKIAPDLEWSRYLTEEDLALADEVILASSWYPLETYKRLGLAVFKLMAKQDLKAAWMWGRASLEEQIRTYKNIVRPNDPLGSIRKFSGYLGRFANFDLMDVEEPGVGQALITFKMKFGDEADEAYAHHLGGVLERLLEVSGAKSVNVDFKEKSWQGHPNTIYEIKWEI